MCAGSVGTLFKTLTAVLGIVGAVVGAVEAFTKELFVASPPPPPPPPVRSIAFDVFGELAGPRYMYDPGDDTYIPRKASGAVLGTPSNGLVASSDEERSGAMPAFGYFRPVTGTQHGVLCDAAASPETAMPPCSTLLGVYYLGPYNVSGASNVAHVAVDFTSLSKAAQTVQEKILDDGTSQFFQFRVSDGKVRTFASATAFAAVVGGETVAPRVTAPLITLGLTIDDPSSGTPMSQGFKRQNGRVTSLPGLNVPQYPRSDPVATDVGKPSYEHETFVVVEACQSRVVLSKSRTCADVTDATVCDKFAVMHDDGRPYACMPSIGNACERSRIACGAQNYTLAFDDGRTSLLENRYYKDECTDVYATRENPF